MCEEDWKKKEADQYTGMADIQNVQFLLVMKARKPEPETCKTNGSLW